jgi:hypothetical protein
MTFFGLSDFFMISVTKIFDLFLTVLLPPQLLLEYLPVEDGQTVDAACSALQAVYRTDEAERTKWSDAFKNIVTFPFRQTSRADNVVS